MLTIRAAQLESLTLDHENHIVNHLADGIRQHWPVEYARLGETESLALARKALKDANGFGITGMGEVMRYLNLMLLLGPSFDRDERYPWARAFLEDNTMRPEARMRRLSELALKKYTSGRGISHGT